MFALQVNSDGVIKNYTLATLKQYDQESRYNKTQDSAGLMWVFADGDNFWSKAELSDFWTNLKDYYYDIKLSLIRRYPSDPPVP